MAKKKKQVTPMRMRRRLNRRQEINPFWPLLFVCLIAVGLFSREAAGLAVIGLAPTIVLGMTGKGVHKTEKLQCVGFMNIAGVLPFMAQVMSRPDDFIYVVANPINLVAMFGAAAVGYALIYVGPMLAAMVLQSLSQERIKNINQQRQALVELWGAEVIPEKGETEEEPDWAKAPIRPKQ
jgi:hypothetical protein